MTDLAIAGARVIDPERRIDDRVGVGVAGGRITPPGDAGTAAETIDATGLVLVPGLVDLHTHLYQGVSHYGIDPDASCLRRCVTTAVGAAHRVPRPSRGSAGTSSGTRRPGSSLSCMSPCRE